MLSSHSMLHFSSPLCLRGELLHAPGSSVFVAATQGMRPEHLALVVREAGVPGSYRTVIKWGNTSWEDNTPKALHRRRLKYILFFCKTGLFACPGTLA